MRKDKVSSKKQLKWSVYSIVLDENDYAPDKGESKFSEFTEQFHWICKAISLNLVLNESSHIKKQSSTKVNFIKLHR